MILLLGGTTEGREAAARLEEAGYPVLLTVVSDYGAGIAAPFASEVRVGAMDAAEMTKLIAERSLTAVVDAAHPFAAAAHESAREAARSSDRPYLRLERQGGQPDTAPGPSPGILREADFPAAAARAAATGDGTVFLTTGSRTLPLFLNAARERGRRVVARVLPDPQVLTQCLALGMTAADIVAMQGPFDHELNLALFRRYGAGVVVTKDSGEVGGLSAKLSAAAQLQVPVVLVERPRSGSGESTVVERAEDLADALRRLGIRPTNVE